MRDTLPDGMRPVDHFRAYSRSAVSLPAKLLVTEERWSLPAQVTDLGLGGAGVRFAQSVPVGTSVQLSITAPHRWDPLVVDGRVVWVQHLPEDSRLRAGVCFEHRAGPALHALAELLASNLYG